MDKLNTQFRHFIRSAFSTLEGQRKFKGITVNKELAAMGIPDLSEERQITNPLSCGESTNRLCWLLTGDEMKDILTSADTADISDDEAMFSELRDMMHIAPGNILVRINIVGPGAGHAYLFLSEERKTLFDRIDGYIYQSNVAVNPGNIFGIKDWISDVKSERLISLPWHFRELQDKLLGLSWSEPATPVEFYDENYMLSDKTMTAAVISDLRKISKGSLKVIFRWKRASLETLVQNLATVGL